MLYDLDIQLRPPAQKTYFYFIIASTKQPRLPVPNYHV